MTPTDDGVVIALPFGVRADWLKNVLAAGSATIVHEGDTFGVDSPEVVPIDEAAEYLSEQARHVHELLDVEPNDRVTGWPDCRLACGGVHGCGSARTSASVHAPTA